MIYTCTLNPAVDKIAHVDSIQLNQINRLLQVESDAGGKGINVSRDIKILLLSAFWEAVPEPLWKCY